MLVAVYQGQQLFDLLLYSAILQGYREEPPSGLLHIRWGVHLLTWLSTVELLWRKSVEPPCDYLYPHSSITTRLAHLLQLVRHLEKEYCSTWHSKTVHMMTHLVWGILLGKIPWRCSPPQREKGPLATYHEEAFFFEERRTSPLRSLYFCCSPFFCIPLFSALYTVMQVLGHGSVRVQF